MRLTIELECPSWMKKGMSVAVPVLAIGVAGVALATPKAFVSGDLLTAAALNDSFTDLQGRVTTLEAVPKMVTASCTIDNGNAIRSAAAPLDAACGYNMIPAGAFLSGVRVSAGLKDGCEVRLQFDAVHAQDLPRIAAQVVGFSNAECADVGIVTIDYAYFLP